MNIHVRNRKEEQERMLHTLNSFKQAPTEKPSRDDELDILKRLDSQPQIPKDTPLKVLKVHQKHQQNVLIVDNYRYANKQ